MLGALNQLGLSAVDNAWAHMTHLEREVINTDGVIDRIIEPVLPFLAHEKDARRKILNALAKFKVDDSIGGRNRLGLMKGLTDLWDRLDLGSFPNEDSKRDQAIKDGRRISDDVVFREQYLSRQLGSPVRVLTALGDIAMFTGLGSEFSDPEEFFSLDFWVVQLPKTDEFEIRIAPHNYDTPSTKFLYANLTFPFERGIEAGGALFFGGWENPNLRIVEKYMDVTQEEVLSILRGAFAFLDIDKRNLKFEFVET